MLPASHTQLPTSLQPELALLNMHRGGIHQPSTVRVPQRVSAHRCDQGPFRRCSPSCRNARSKTQEHAGLLLYPTSSDVPPPWMYVCGRGRGRLNSPAWWDPSQLRTYSGTSGQVRKVWCVCGAACGRRSSISIFMRRQALFLGVENRY